MHYLKTIISNNLKINTLGTKKSYPNAIILCLHGWLDNVGSFIPLIEENPKLPWLCTDLIGHGHSVWRHENQHYYFHDYINDFMIWLESQKSDTKIHLVGHSLGAAIASILSGLLPEKIQSCILLDGLGPLVSNNDSIAEQWRLAMHQYGHLRPKRPYPNLDALIKARSRKHHIKKSSCELLVKYGHIFDEKEQQYYWSFDQRLLNLSPVQMTQEQVLSIISHIKCPTLLINAQQGYPFDGPLYDARKNKVKTLEEIKIEGGHHVHMDNPQLIYTYMIEFYKKHNIVL